MTGWRSSLVLLDFSGVIFLTTAAYDNEIVHQEKKEQFLVFICISDLNGDVFFEDWGCDFKRVSCDILGYFWKYVHIQQCFYEGKVKWENCSNEGKEK